MLISYNLKKMIWSKLQPVTYKPANKKDVVSDLFVWLNSPERKTYFDLISIYSLFCPSKSNTLSNFTVRFVFFDNDGKKFAEEKISINSLQKKTIDLSVFLSKSSASFGTFAVFHENIPNIFLETNSYLSERGYVSYSSQKDNLRHYVHGNFDAISINSSRNLKMLGGLSLFKRQYKLQCLIDSDAKFSLALTNPSPLKQRISFSLIDSQTREIMNRESFLIASCGCIIFSPKINNCGSSFLVIESHLVMARPVVFKEYVTTGNVDIFHG